MLICLKVQLHVKLCETRFILIYWIALKQQVQALQKAIFYENPIHDLPSSPRIDWKENWLLIPYGGFLKYGYL